VNPAEVEAMLEEGIDISAETPKVLTTEAVEISDVVITRLDRLLPVWILLAMAAGLLIGRWFPGVQSALDAVKVGQTSLPIALGLLLMMYPVLAKVRYEDMSHATGDRQLLWLSLLLNWVVGPATSPAASACGPGAATGTRTGSSRG
jgi:hypothetical protein